MKPRKVWLHKCMAFTLHCRRFVVVFLTLLCIPSVEGQDLVVVNFEFSERPPNVTSNTTATFRFSLVAANASDPCGAGCAIQCELDDAPFVECADRTRLYTGLVDGDHVFTIFVSTSKGFFYTNKQFWTVVELLVFVELSEPCSGGGGFKCEDISDCSLYVAGPGEILPSTFAVVTLSLSYILKVSLSTKVSSGKVLVAMQKGFCADAAGNVFRRNENSSAIIQFDRSLPTVNMWTPIQDAQVQINDDFRTVLATNSLQQLIVYLDFSETMLTTTEQLVESLEVSEGVLSSTNRKSRGNRRFGFLISNVSDFAIITVNLPSNFTLSRYGTPFRNSVNITILYDTVRPKVTVSTTSPAKTSNQLLPILIQFTKPVFLFDATGITMSGGSLTRFNEVSKSTYALEIFVEQNHVVSVGVGENVTYDIAENPNVQSNVLRVRHYTTPSFAVALSSFTTAGFIATVLASGALSTSQATLAATGTLTNRPSAYVGSDSSRNLLGMAIHLQAFALPDCVVVSLPVEFREATKRLKWLIPHHTTPWQKHQTNTTESNPIFGSQVQSQIRIVRSPMRSMSHLGGYRPSFPRIPEDYEVSAAGRVHSHDRRLLDTNTNLFGPALTPNEYSLYFEIDTSNNYLKEIFVQTNYTGWRDFAKNMFWLAVFGGGLVFLHGLLALFLRWKTSTWVRGALTFPQFELFLLVFALPCICQAGVFIIRGGTTLGIIFGVLLLAAPAAYLLSVIVVLVIAIFMGSFVQYREVLRQGGGGSSQDERWTWRWRGKIIELVAGRDVLAKWVCGDGLSPVFLSRYGMYFVDRKGPPKLMAENSGQSTKWLDSGSYGVGDMEAVNLHDESEDVPVTWYRKLLGGIQAFYFFVDVLRRITLGVIFGAFTETDDSWTQVSIALGITVFQAVYLITVKPYIRRGVQVVESISLLCETGLFLTMIILLALSNPADNHFGVGIFLLVLLLVSFVAQLVNEWYALMTQLLHFSRSQESSFKEGLKLFGRGLLIPFIPLKQWPRFIGSEHPHSRMGLVPVVRMSQESEPEQGGWSSSVHQGSLPVATGRQPASLGYDSASPVFVVPGNAATEQVLGCGEVKQDLYISEQNKPAWSSQCHLPGMSMEGKRSTKGTKNDLKSELKVLRELARASFPTSKKQEESTLADPGLERSSPVPSDLNLAGNRLNHSSSAPGVSCVEELCTLDETSSGSSSDDEGYASPEQVGGASPDINAAPSIAMLSSSSFEKASEASGQREHSGS